MKLKSFHIILTGYYFFLVTGNVSSQNFPLKADKSPETSVYYVNKKVNLKATLGFMVFQSINRKVYTAATEGEIKAYKDANLTLELTLEEVLQSSSIWETIKIDTDPVYNPGKWLIDSSVITSINFLVDITGYSVSEKIIFDMKMNSFSNELYAFGMNSFKKDDSIINGNKLHHYSLNAVEPLFWISAHDLYSLLTKDELLILKYALFQYDILSLISYPDKPDSFSQDN
jgi:hypothetical protein